MRTMTIKTMDELEADGWKINYKEIDESSGCDVELKKEGVREVIVEDMFDFLGARLEVEAESEEVQGFYDKKEGWLWPIEAIKEVTQDA